MVTLAGLAIRGLTAFARRLGDPLTATGAAVPVSAVMLTRVETVTPTQRLEDAASLLVRGRQSFVPVVQNGAAIGVITKEDVATGLRLVGPRASIADAPYHDVVTVTPADSLADVLEKLRESPDCVAVVFDNGEPVGLLTFDQIVEYMQRKRAA